jgi:hypothetical protein
MLAFGHLGADAALTEVFQDNHSSQGVSRKLGYEPDGISRDARGGEAVVSDRLRLTRQKWQSQPQASARVAGFADCRSTVSWPAAACSQTARAAASTAVRQGSVNSHARPSAVRTSPRIISQSSSSPSVPGPAVPPGRSSW